MSEVKLVQINVSQRKMAKVEVSPSIKMPNSSSPNFTLSFHQQITYIYNLFFRYLNFHLIFRLSYLDFFNYQKVQKKLVEVGKPVNITHFTFFSSTKKRLT